MREIKELRIYTMRTCSELPEAKVLKGRTLPEAQRLGERGLPRLGIYPRETEKLGLSWRSSG